MKPTSLSSSFQIITRSQRCRIHCAKPRTSTRKISGPSPILMDMITREKFSPLHLSPRCNVTTNQLRHFRWNMAPTSVLKHLFEWHFSMVRTDFQLRLSWHLARKPTDGRLCLLMCLVVRKDRQSMTAREAIFYGRFLYSLVGLVLLVSKFECFENFAHIFKKV